MDRKWTFLPTFAGGSEVRDAGVSTHEIITEKDI